MLILLVHHLSARSGVARRVESGPHGAVLSCGVRVFFFPIKKIRLDFFLRDRRGYSNHVDLRYLGRRAEISRGVNGRRVFCPDF